jgi:RNA polymerase sigma-70 factor (ECF subfamily)
MNQESQNRRLGEISTLWGLIAEAAGSSPAAVSAAQQALLERYGGAVRRYLLGALRDPEVADDLFQEFALRFVRGDFFEKASPERGRFRNFVKTSIFNLVVDYQRRQRRRRRSTEPLRDEPAVSPPSQTDSERDFLTSWREQLLERTWLALAEHERQTGAPYNTVLRFRAEQPLLSSSDMAEHLSIRLGKAYTVDGIRQVLHRARERFADLLVEEVVQSLESASADRLEEELSDLGLLTVCRVALQRRCRPPRKRAGKGVMPDEDDV